MYLYLAPIKRSPSALDADPKKERPNYTDIIQQLVHSFCYLLEHLDQQLSQAAHRISFTAGSRVLPPSMVQRRNMEFLAVIVLNMGSENKAMWDRTQKVRVICHKRCGM